jgi:2-C-methyl-D-erythritol 4-phosphate cytidylyltransferase / 2-C-methyl-D-erythritol 2,4-cyclodiphosphate synthase
VKTYAILLAAGSGQRFGADKVLAPLCGKPIWRWSFDAFLSHPEVDGVGIVCSESNRPEIEAMAPEAAFVCVGGDTRQESARLGLGRLPADGEMVLVHDGARPFVTQSIVSRVLDAARRTGAAAPGVPVVDTVRQLGPEGARLLDRTQLRAMQTPQAMRVTLLRSAYDQSEEVWTDEMALLQAAGTEVEIVEGDERNFKVTSPDDWNRARSLAGAAETRTGLGYDIHAFSSDPSRKLWLGGVAFDDAPALEGHSDADVLLHAAVDALLGAAALGDIGQHFPNTEPRWSGEPSITFLVRARDLLRESGWRIVHLDIAVLAERPKIMPRAQEIRQRIAGCLEIASDRVSVKATTNERLGSIGRGEGIAAFATATISRD